MNRNLLLTGLIASSLIYALPAAARERQPYERGWYGGVGVASNTYDLTTSYLNSHSGVVANPAETSVDNKSLGFTLYAGWRFMKYLSLDIGYADFGSAHYHLGDRVISVPADPTSCGTYPCSTPVSYGPSDYSLHTSAVRFLFKGSLPLGTHWTLDGHIGPGLEWIAIRNGTSDNESSSRFMGTLGFSGSYAITKQWRLHIDWDSYAPLIISGDSQPLFTSISNGIYDDRIVTSISLNIEYRL